MLGRHTHAVLSVDHQAIFVRNSCSSSLGSLSRPYACPLLEIVNLAEQPRSQGKSAIGTFGGRGGGICGRDDLRLGMMLRDGGPVIVLIICLCHLPLLSRW